MEVRCHGLTKRFRVAEKDPGMAGTLRHFVRRRHRTIDAVADVSFGIAAGEVVGFLGPNGAGKTTTLKMLSGLLHPTSGEVEVAGHVPFSRKADFLRRITLVMGQKQQLLWDLPVLDSLRVNGAVYGLDDATRDRRTKELAEMLELGRELTQPVRKLSLGERMKAELMAALLHEPRILFLDEPTLGLDVNAQASVRAFLRDYNRRFGATVLLTSHYMADITALCPRVLLIHQGKLVFDGRLEELTSRFAPYREIQAELGPAWSGDGLERFGEVESQDGQVVRWLVPRDRLTDTVSRMMAELPVVDLTIREPPVEEVIGRVFRAGGPANPSSTS